MMVSAELSPGHQVAFPAPGGSADPAPMTPVLHRVVEKHKETSDVCTIALLPLFPLSGRPGAFEPGQFFMLTALGVGEAAFSISSSPHEGGPLRYTVRDVGPVTHALWQSEIGDVVGVRGPFGTGWGSKDLGDDVVVVAGGIGLAPLRGAVDELVARGRDGGARVWVLAGARDPGQIVFADGLDSWSKAGARVAVTVDVGAPRWRGHVGPVTSLLAHAGFDPPRTTALICGPEIMMRFAARALVDLGVDPHRIRVSLERNMQCGLAWCGHCQLGPFLLCRDGPVLSYAGAVEQLLAQRER